MFLCAFQMAADDSGWDPIGGVGDVINGANAVVSYLSDPWGNTFTTLQGAAQGMSRDILPALTSATLPDLTADWFLTAYKISFGTAIFVAVLLLIPQAVRTARGAQAGRDLVESVGLYFGTFLLGAMFGPAFGMVLIRFFHSLTDVFITAGLTGSVDSITSEFETMISEADPVGLTGGVVLAVVLMVCIIIGLFLVLLMLLVQLVTLYFTGVLFPLGLVWIIDKNKRSFGLKLGTLWLGVLAAHPLLFLLLGLAFSMMASQVSAFGNNFSLQSMVTLLVAIIALTIAALSPVLLMKFAPVIPMAFGGTSGPALSSGNQIGPSNMTDAGKDSGKSYPGYAPGSGRAGTPPSSDPADTAGDSGPTDGGTEGPGGAGGNRGGMADAAAGRGHGSTTSSGGGAEEWYSPPEGGDPGSATNWGRVAAGPNMTGSAGGGQAAGEIPAAARLGGASAGGGAGAAEGTALAAGAAESATGVGAVVGVPTLIVAAAGAAASAGAAAAKKSVSLAQTAGENAADGMDDSPST